jgi:hypothetical protein
MTKTSNEIHYPVLISQSTPLNACPRVTVQESVALVIFMWHKNILCRPHEVFARSNAGTVGSNPTQGIDVCLRVCACVVLCVGSGLGTG